MVTLSLLLPLLATLVSFLILILPSLIRSLLSLVHVSTTFVIFVASAVLDFDTARTIGISLVHSRVDYSNSLYYCLPKSQLSRLQHIQNALARAVVAAPRSSIADHILRSLHWLKVQERIEYKVISTTCKLFQSSSPRYLRDLITVQPSRSILAPTFVTSSTTSTV